MLKLEYMYSRNFIFKYEILAKDVNTAIKSDIVFANARNEFYSAMICEMFIL